MTSKKLKEITDRILLKSNMIKGRSISLVDNIPVLMFELNSIHGDVISLHKIFEDLNDDFLPVILAQVVRHKEFCESRRPIRTCDIEDIANTYREVWEYSNNYILSNYSLN